MNGKIMTGAGVAVMVWGIVAMTYGQGGSGAALLVVGIVLLVLGLRQPKRGQ